MIVDDMWRDLMFGDEQMWQEVYDRSYPEDAHLENGNYVNTCCICGEQFVGHKRRVVCKLCHEESSV